MKKSLLFILFIGLILVLVACGGDDSSATSDTGDTAETETAEQEDSSATEEEGSSASGEPAPNNEITVKGTNFDFDQDEYVVQSGEEVTVTYVNEEGNHGISIDEFDVNIQGEGEATFIPEEPGEYEIYCNIFCGEGHDDMVATLVVV